MFFCYDRGTLFNFVYLLLQETLNSVDDKKKVHIDENELGPNILADRRNKLETAAQVSQHFQHPQ